MDKLIIAIDGYSGTGKSSQAIRLAKKMNYTYIDTGAMYRAVTLFGLNQEPRGSINLNLLNQSLNHINIHFEEVKKQNLTFLNNKNVTKAIREPRVLKYVSKVAAQKPVRSFLTRKQQFLGKDRGVVIDGRDIGTVVFPMASCKFFLTAAAEIRAKRRYLEQQKIGIKETYEDVLTNITKRDNQDKSRTISPLKKAKDAIEIDVSNLNLDEVFHILYQRVLEKLEPRI
tara:strand:+ start:276 stop:959 length:684 start_codon:yes stop_codon:yes gene_type:complete